MNINDKKKLKKLLIVCSIITALGISACSVDNNTASVVSEEEDIQEEKENNDLETRLEQEDKIEKLDNDEQKKDVDELNRIDIDLREKLITEGNVKDDEIRLFHQEDFDDDGTDEAFALVMWNNTKEFEDGQIVEGDVWFVSPNECQKLRTSDGMGFDETDHILRLGNTKYELFDDIYATGRLTYAWYVAAGKVKEAPFSKIGTVITDTDGKNRFRILDSNYDAEYDPEVGGTLGHTWKQYYFFYDETNDRICEYGGTDIENSKAEYLCGIDIVGQCLPAGDKLDSLFYRSNGLVVMNYEHEEDGHIFYHHLIYDFIKGSFIDDNGEETDGEPLDGIYAKALCPDMAVYPEDIENNSFNIDSVLEDKTGGLPSDILSEIEGRYEDGYGDIVEINHPSHMVRFIKGGKQDHIYDEIISGYKVLDNAYLIKIDWNGEKYVYLYRKEGDLEYLYLLSDEGWDPGSETYKNKTLQTYIKTSW